MDEGVVIDKKRCVTMRKTVLHITECLGSGVLYYVKNLTEWQTEDYNIVVAYETRPETPTNFKDQFNTKIKFIRVKGFTREIKPFQDLNAYISIRRIVKEIEPDIIHLHSTKAGVIGRWAINCGKYKVLYSPHAYSFLMQDCGQLKRIMYKIIERISNRRGCLTIADSEGELKASRQVTSTAVCIPNGINLEEMDKVIAEAKKIITRHDRLRVCISGKVVPQKNPLLFNQIAEACPEYDFIWVGGGPLENELTSTNITVTGWKNRKEAIAEILNSDVFLLTSLWESLSVALLEVMYLAIPCVVSNCDGNKDIIRDGINGFLCETVNQYVACITQLERDRDMAKEIGSNARTDIEDTYNTEKMKREYQNLFNAVGV